MLSQHFEKLRDPNDPALIGRVLAQRRVGVGEVEKPVLEAAVEAVDHSEPAAGGR